MAIYMSQLLDQLIMLICTSNYLWIQSVKCIIIKKWVLQIIPSTMYHSHYKMCHPNLLFLIAIIVEIGRLLKHRQTVMHTIVITQNNPLDLFNKKDYLLKMVFQIVKYLSIVLFCGSYCNKLWNGNFLLIGRYLDLEEETIEEIDYNTTPDLIKQDIRH